MAVNYGAQTTEAPELPSYVTPARPVQKDFSWLTSAAQMFGQVGDIVENERENADEKTVAGFTKQQLLVAEGVAQGKYSSVHARTLMRRNLVQAIDSNPALAEEFVKSQASILGIAGGAQVVDEGTQEEQRRNALTDKLIMDGYIAPDATEDQIEKSLSYYQVAQEAQRRFDEQMKTFDMELKSKQVTQARRDEIEELRKVEAQRYLSDLAPAQFQGMKTQLDQIISGAGTEAEKEQAIKDLFISFRSGITGIVGDLTEHQSSALLKPFDMLQQDYLDRATGKLSDEELKRSIERTLNVQQKIALVDPAIAKLAVLNKLMPSALQGLAALSPEGFQAAFDYMATSTEDSQETVNPFVKDTPKKDGLKVHFDAMIKGLGSDDDATQEAAIVALNNLLEGTEDYGNILRKDPLKGQELINFFASPDFLKARNNEGISGAALEGAADIIQRHYADEVWGMVKDEFRTNRIFDESIIERQEQGKPRQLIGEGAQQQPIPAEPTIDTADAVLYKTTAAGVQFYAADRGNSEAVQRARELNRDLKPVINKTVKALAHLEGRTDYGQYWTEVADQVMGATVTGGEGQTQAAGGDAGDDLTIKDFSTTYNIPEQHENVNTVATTIAQELDLQDHHIAGILGNFVVESGSKNLNPTAVGDNGNAVGIAQWNGDRMDALKSWAEGQGLDWQTVDTQVKFLIHELKTTENKAYRKLQQATTAEEAAEAFSVWFERPGTPHLSRRKNEATRIYKAMKG